MKRYAFRRPWKRAAAGLLDSVGGLLFRRRAQQGSPVHHLLIVRLDHLGDVWNCSGLPKALQEYLPQARVSFLVSSAAASLLENNPFIHEVIPFDAPWFWKKGSAQKNLSQLIAELKSRKFDAALSLRGDLREHWMLFCAGIARRIGPGVTGGGFLLTDEVPWRDGRHELERIGDVAAVLGLPPKVWKPEIYFAEGEAERHDGEWEALFGRQAQNLLLFQIDAGSTAKLWPLEHSAVFLNTYLSENPQRRVFLSGMDRFRAEALLKRIEPQFASRVLSGVGRLTLRALAAASGRFALAVGPDSGPLHLLSWRGVPTLFLYSGTNELESWKPLAEHAVVLKHDVACAPCGLRSCPVSGHPCLSGIRPEEVLRAVRERGR